jgi:hypothetical protein
MVSVSVSALADTTRTKPELIAEKALLRQQLSVLKRSVKHPKINSQWAQSLGLAGPSDAALETDPIDFQPNTLLRVEGADRKLRACLSAV